MLQPRALQLLLALVLLCAAPLAQASEKSGRNVTDPDWNKTHPRTNAYDKAFKEKRWSDAAAILRTWDVSNDYYRLYEDYAQVFDALGEKEEALRHLDTRLRFCFTRKEEIKPMEEVRRLAKYAHDRELRSSIPIAAALQYDLSGESDISFALLQNLDPKDVYAALAPALQKEMAYKAFQAAYKRGNHEAAAALTAYILDQGMALLEHAPAMAESGVRARDKALTLQLMEYKIHQAGTTTDQKLALAKEAKDYAGDNNLKPSDWLVRFYTERGLGHGLRQLAELDAELRTKKGNPNDHPVKLQYLRELLPELIETTFMNKAYDKTIACFAYIDWLPYPPGDKLLNRMIVAHELAGKPDVAIQLCLKYAWFYSGEKVRVCDPQGNPELIKLAATIALKTNKPTGVPLVDAWANFKKDKNLKNLQALWGIAFANELRPETFDANEPFAQINFGESSTCALASFLCGDAHMELGTPWRALYWYQRATYLVSEVMAGSPKDVTEDSHFHEVLGVARQARLLGLMGKPETAEAELKGLLAADPSLRTEVLERNSLLREEWRAAEAAIQRAKKTPVKMGSPEAEAMQKRDVVESPASDFEERKTAATKIPQLRSTKKATVAMAERLARPKYNGSASRFMESYLEQERQARLIVVRSEDPNPSGSGAPEARPQRRCASCLGSGKAGYVTGSRFYSRDRHNMPTNNQVSADCSHCNGTGWR